MPDSVVPDPEFQPAADLAERRADKAVASYLGLAEREAAHIVATSRTGTPGEIRDAVTLGFLKGFMSGYGEVVVRLDEVISQYEQDGAV